MSDIEQELEEKEVERIKISVETPQEPAPPCPETKPQPSKKNYYYGTTKTSTKPKRRKKKVVESSSDDSDSDYEPVKKTIKKPVSKSMPKGKSPIIDTPQDNPYQREINKLKFSYG